MALVEITNHADQAPQNLLAQFKEKANIEGFLRALMVPVQELEGIFFEIELELRLDNSVGEQLDMIGRIVQRVRGGLDDDAYRTAIRARIRSNRSNGTPDDILEVLRLMVQTNDIEYNEYPTGIVLRVRDVMGENPEAVVEEVRRARPGAVKQTLEYQTFDEADTFTFADADVAQADNLRGFGAPYPYYNGGISALLRKSYDAEDWEPENGAGGLVAYYGMAYNNITKQYCAVGTTGIIETSEDGVNWTVQTAGGGFGGQFNGVAHDHNGLWCAVGQFGEIQTSPDGVTWTPQTADAGYTGIFTGVRHDQSGLWVIAGQSGEIQTSPDGVNWTRQTQDAGYAGNFGDVAYNGSDLWCVVGTVGEIQTSPDGVTWTRRKTGSHIFYGLDHNMEDLWCAVGDGGNIWTSPDGIAWTQRTPDAGYTNVFYDVRSDGIQWLAIGQVDEIQTSPDGINWTQQDFGSSIITVSCLANDLGGRMALVKEA